MNAKVLIVALCAFQLAAGDAITDMTKTFQNDMSSTAAQAQAQAESATQNIQHAAYLATQNITLQIQAGTDNAQKYANNLNISLRHAQACLNNQTQQYAAIANATQAQIQQQVSSHISQVKDANQTFHAAVTNANNTVGHISSQNNSCSATGRFSCTATATTQVTRVATEFHAAFQSATQIFSQISTSATEGDMAQKLNLTIRSAQTQLQQVSQQTTHCLQQAAASDIPPAASTANGSAPNGTSNSTLLPLLLLSPPVPVFGPAK